MTFVPKGNQNPRPDKDQQTRVTSPSRARGEHLNRTHDGTGGLHVIAPAQPEADYPIKGWPRADQL